MNFQHKLNNDRSHVGLLVVLHSPLLRRNSFFRTMTYMATAICPEANGPAILSGYQVLAGHSTYFSGHLLFSSNSVLSTPFAF